MELRPDQPAPKSVLVVDDDPKSVRILEVSLRNEGFEVKVASDAAAATAWLEQNVPGLVIAATTLQAQGPGQGSAPGLDQGLMIDGFELCRRLKEQPAYASVPFVLMGDPTAANKIRGIELGAEEFVAKPVYVKDVVGRVSLLFRRQTRQRMASDAGGDQGMAGDLADISVVDLIQTLESNRRSGVVHLKSPQSGHADVYFRQGAVVDAEVGRLSGREAMLRLFSWSQGTYQIEVKSIRRKDAIAMPPGMLVMEGMRRLEQWQRLLKDLPSLQTVFEVDYRLLAERLAEIPDEVNGLLRLFDGTRTLLNVIDDCGIADSEALTIAGKLFGEGIIRDVQAPAEEQPDGESSSDGWLTEAAGPFRPPAGSVEAETTSDTDVHRRPTGPLETLEKPDAPGAAAAQEDAEADATTQFAEVAPDPGVPSPATAEATPGPTPDVSEAPATDAQADEAVDQALDALALLDSDGGAERAPPQQPAPHESEPIAADGVPAVRPDEAVVAIRAGDEPAPGDPEDAGDVRRTLLGVAGIPDQAEAAGELGTPHELPMARRGTELGLGPVVGGPTPLVVATVASTIVPAHPAPETPFSQSASNWMSVGDEMSRSQALDELALPSRHRGLFLLIGGALAVTAVLFGARQWQLAHPDEPAAASSPGEHRPAAEQPATAPVPAAAPAPVAVPAQAEPAANAAIALPAPAAAAQPAPPPPLETKPVPEAKPAPAPAHPVAVEAAPAPPASKATSAVPAKAPAASAEGADTSGHFPALFDKCRAAFSQGRMREAAAACTVAKEANPDSGEALLLLAHAEFNRNHLKEALQWAEKAIKIDPNMADAYVIFGGVQQDAGHNREAKWAYKKYLELAPRGQYAADLRAIVDTL